MQKHRQSCLVVGLLALALLGSDLAQAEPCFDVTPLPKNSSRIIDGLGAGRLKIFVDVTEDEVLVFSAREAVGDPEVSLRLISEGCSTGGPVATARQVYEGVGTLVAEVIESGRLLLVVEANGPTRAIREVRVAARTLAASPLIGDSSSLVCGNPVEPGISDHGGPLRRNDPIAPRVDPSDIDFSNSLGPALLHIQAGPFDGATLQLFKRVSCEISEWDELIELEPGEVFSIWLPPGGYRLLTHTPVRGTDTKIFEACSLQGLPSSVLCPLPLPTDGSLTPFSWAAEQPNYHRLRLDQKATISIAVDSPVPAQVTLQTQEGLTIETLALEPGFNEYRKTLPAGSYRLRLDNRWSTATDYELALTVTRNSE